jgi:dodecin
MARVVKIVELMGVSEQSFSDAVRQAVKEASQTIRNITGVEVIKSTAQVEGDEILEYHVTVRLAFAIERGGSVADEGDEDEAREDEEPRDEGEAEESRDEGEDEEEEPRDEGEDEEEEPRDEDEEEEAPRDEDEEEEAPRRKSKDREPREEDEEDR